MTLYDLLVKSARAALAQQSSDGSMPSGHNGPYHDLETPVRNTAHWLITFIKAFELTGAKPFHAAAESAIDYLTSSEARPMGKTFWIRKNPEKDFSNGLVGQAWVIEALITAAKAFSREDLTKIANKTFLLHSYNKVSGGWHIVNVDGSYGSLDFTFNHQLWFAASGGLIMQVTDTQLQPEVTDFLNRLDEHLTLYSSGLIRHKSLTFLSPTITKRIRNLVGSLRNGKGPDYLRMKSTGYHGFNLYGFALLKTTYPFHGFWASTKFRKTLNYAMSENFRNAIADNKYGYPYNPPGFEVPYAFKVFRCGAKSEQKHWVYEQLTRSFEKETDLLTRNTEDPNTMAARLYEATRLDNIPIEITL